MSKIALSCSNTDQVEKKYRDFLLEEAFISFEQGDEESIDFRIDEINYYEGLVENKD